MAAKELPAKGWVEPGQVIYCDACGRRTYVYEVHHLIPVSWGGSDSRLLTDRQVIWVRLDGDCHATVHMILDRAQRDGGWPDTWINSHGGIPHLVVETARRGWNTYRAQTFGGGT